MTEENNKKEFYNRKTSILHLIYVVVILLLIIFFLFISKYTVCRESLDSFTFAATITSIVLAVVSIVYTIKSGFSNFGRLGNMQAIENKVNDQLNKFSDIAKKIEDVSQTVGNVESKVDILTSRQTELNKNIWSYQNQNNNEVASKDNEDKFNYQGSSIVGCLIIYACFLSEQYKKRFNDKVLNIDNEHRGYILGFIVGLRTIKPNVLKLVESNDAETDFLIETIDKTYFGDICEIEKFMADITKNIKNSTKDNTLELEIKYIKNYFESPDTDSVE